MFKLKSQGQFEIKGRGTVFVVYSPISAARDHAALLSAIGVPVEIDGKLYTPIGFDLHCLGTPVSAGEKIGILVHQGYIADCKSTPRKVYEGKFMEPTIEFPKD
jgi:hypothetical protein